MLKQLNRRQIVAGAAIGLAQALASKAALAATRPVVAELFTSQGCSSCPPADEVFNGLAGRAGVVALTYHVDYWDYLGWRDTLASSEFSQRQYDYAKSRGDMDVYTPQAVINGRKHVVGSREADVSAAMRAAAAEAPGPWVDFSIESHGNDLTVQLPAVAGAQESTLWLLAVSEVVDVKIERGENAGRTLHYSNVVRKMLPAGMWTGDAAKIVMPRVSCVTKDSASCVALLQLGKVGPIIGVSQISNPA